MALCKLTQCCCGCSLQTGTKVIGVWFLIGATGGFIQAFSQMLASFDRDDGDRMLLDSISWMIGSIAAMAATVSVQVAAWNNRHPVLIVPWLVLKSVSLTVGIAFVSYMGIMSIRGNGSSSGIVYFAGAFIATAIVSYSWLVIYSYYQELVATGKKLVKCDEENEMKFGEC
ncbi:uncharacterized protein LOC130693674 [Daphnia carinata]|uniref:uncharacterized protein LOC130693674 n=1 Tax=Daphnia carinata TaxID=120202 RepID=UPI00257EF366|nr:uncharacterized protein LOC130693674 [Daphnia carinata]